MYGNRTDTNILTRPFGVLVNLLPRILHVPGSNPPRASGLFLHFYKRSYFQSYTPSLSSECSLRVAVNTRVAFCSVRVSQGHVCARL